MGAERAIPPCPMWDCGSLGTRLGGSSVGGLTLGLVGKLEQAIHMHNLAGSQACCAEVKYKPLLNSLDSTVGKTRPETVLPKMTLLERQLFPLFNVQLVCR